MNASAWIDTNRSAWTRRAFLTRSCSGTKKSASRVSIARIFGCALMRSRSCSAICSTTSFWRRRRGRGGERRQRLVHAADELAERVLHGLRGLLLGLLLVADQREQRVAL